MIKDIIGKIKGIGIIILKKIEVIVGKLYKKYIYNYKILI
jgi:hypothetical protein